MKINITPQPYKYNEAFCLMYYEAHTEKKMGFLVWNSRDGVTPFCVMEDGVEYQHVHYGMDRRVLNEEYLKRAILVPGQRIFRGLTLEEAKFFAVRRLRQAKGTRYEVEENSPRWNELVESLTQDFYGNGDEPHMVTLKVDLKGEIIEKPKVYA